MIKINTICKTGQDCSCAFSEEIVTVNDLINVWVDGAYHYIFVTSLIDETDLITIVIGMDQSVLDALKLLPNISLIELFDGNFPSATSFKYAGCDTPALGNLPLFSL